MSAALVDHLWQSTLCLGIAAMLAWACRNAGAHVTMERLLIEGAERPRLDAGAGASAEQTAAR